MPEKPSITAEMVALVRARDQAQPPAKRVVDDALAGRFLELAGSRLTRLGGAQGLLAATAAGLFKLPLVGFAALVLARHRVMDELLLAETAAGATQCVILGAGYDARAYRLAPPKGPARYYEVDHPTLSSRKHDLVAQALGSVPPHVSFVAVDFMREKLDERLVAEGFDRAARTVFIWEGVTYYLSPEAVRGTLRTVRGLAAPGSTIVFDGWARQPGLLGAAGEAGRQVSRVFGWMFGEPFLFQFANPDESASLLRESGYEVLFNHGSAALRAVLRSCGRSLLHVPPHLVVAAGRIPIA